MADIDPNMSFCALLPQGQAERMVAQMDSEGFGAYSFTGACAVECPASVALESINRLNQEYLGPKIK